MGKHTLVIILVMITAAGMLLACGGKTKVEFKSKQVVAPKIIGIGYGFGDGAEKKAREAAVFEATAQCDPRSIHFDYLRVDSYTMFKMDKVGSCDINIVKTEKLDNGGVMVVAEALRTREALKNMRFMTTVNFTLNCKGDKLRRRAEKCNSLIYEKALTHFAQKQYDSVPEKMKGNFTFFLIDKMDDGKKMTVNVSAYVGLAKGKLDKAEKSMVLMNAWRSQCALGNGDSAAPIFAKAMKLTPNATYAEEYAVFELSRNNLKVARKGIKKAIKLSPYESKYLKILYQIEKQSGNEAGMAEVQKSLEEMEAWEDNPGADLTNNFQYRTKVRWEEGGKQDSGGMIHFREATDEDDE